MLAALSDRIQNPETEADRLDAYGELKAYVAANPDDVEAMYLWDKYSRRLEGTDWAAQTVSPRP